MFVPTTYMLGPNIYSKEIVIKNVSNNKPSKRIQS